MLVLEIASGILLAYVLGIGLVAAIGFILVICGCDFS